MNESLKSGKQSAKERNLNLDLMRVLACVAVIGLHTLYKESSIINTAFYYLCGFAVPSFLMISGYVLLNRDGIDFRYSFRKISKIVMVMLAWSVVFWIRDIIVGYTTNQLESISIFNIPWRFWIAILQGGDLWHFWYFGALLIIYLCLPLLYKKKQYLRQICLFFIVLCCGIQIVSYYLGEPLQARVNQAFRVWLWFQYLTLGGVLGSGWAKEKLHKINMSTKTHGICLVIITVIVLVYQNVAGRFLFHKLYAEYFYGSIFTVIWLIVLFAFVMRLSLGEKVTGLIKFAAPLTMGVYILHPFIMRSVKCFVEFDTVLLSLVYFVVILVISTAAAWLLSKIPIAKKLIEL